jgi:ATP-dependent Lon protease
MSEIEFTDAYPAQVDEIPAELPVLPLKETVVFPDSMTPLAIGQERSIRLVDDVVGSERLLALVTTRDAELEAPGWDDLYEIGTAAVIHKMIRVPDGTLRILVQGLQRIRVEEPVTNDPYLVARFSAVPDEEDESREVAALTRNAQGLFGRIIGLAPYLPEELQIAAANVTDASALCNLVASTLRLKTEEKQRILELAGAEERLREISEILNRELEVFALGTKIQSQVQSELEKGQRELFLRQQLKTIQEELGEGDPGHADANELRERLDALELPDETRKAADRELARLERLPAAAAEYGVIRTYLDWIATLPWGVTTPDDLDLDRARQILDEDHYDLDKVKERIVEHLAVSKLKQDPAGQILCFVGPPGVGKTSLGQSVARTLGRKFARLSVGAVRDEAEIRGHRRTYIGAMPGTIIRALRDAESMNPVLLIDEIDKMGADVRGDPASAMLEVLDRAQNSTFRDHYLDLPFDLSKTLFICTANTVDTIPPALLDRMDTIKLSGYTEEEKLGIAKRYLVPRQVGEHGLEPRQITIGERVLRRLAREYTREAGVRGLERRIGDLCRKAAVRVARGEEERIRVTERLVREWLGPRRFSAESPRRTADPGVATGLAYTQVGGDILFVEAGVPGPGEAHRDGAARRGDAGIGTGGAVMGSLPHRGARARRAVVRPPRRPRARAGRRGAQRRAFRRDRDGDGDRVPRPRDAVADDVAMTGEITLTGQVLPIGGVRDKVLAAQRAGLGRVILPRENEHDLEELPPETREAVGFVLVDSIDQVFEAAFGSNGSRANGRVRPETSRR